MLAYATRKVPSNVSATIVLITGDADYNSNFTIPSPYSNFSITRWSSSRPIHNPQVSRLPSLKSSIGTPEWPLRSQARVQCKGSALYQTQHIRRSRARHTGATFETHHHHAGLLSSPTKATTNSIPNVSDQILVQVANGIQAFEHPPSDSGTSFAVCNSMNR